MKPASVWDREVNAEVEGGPVIEMLREERMSAGRTCRTKSSREPTGGRIAFSISAVESASGPIWRLANVSRGANEVP